MIVVDTKQLSRISLVTCNVSTVVIMIVVVLLHVLVWM